MPAVTLAQLQHALFETVPGDLVEIAVQCAALGNREARQVHRSEIELELAAISDFQGGGKRFGHLGKDLRHLIGRLYVELVVGELHAVDVVDAFACLNAQQDVVRSGVLLAQVVAIVRGDERDIELGGQPNQFGVDAALLFKSLVLELDVVVAAPEDLDHLADGMPGAVGVAVQQQPADLSRQAAGRSNEPFGMLGERLLIDARSVVEPLQVADAGELHQVAVAGAVLGQEHLVIGRLAGSTRRAVEP